MKDFLSSSNRGCSGQIRTHDYCIQTSCLRHPTLRHHLRPRQRHPRRKAPRLPSVLHVVKHTGCACVQHLLRWVPKTGTAWSGTRGFALIASLLLTQFAVATTIIPVDIAINGIILSFTGNRDQAPVLFIHSCCCPTRCGSGR